MFQWLCYRSGRLRQTPIGVMECYRMRIFILINLVAKKQPRWINKHNIQSHAYYQIRSTPPMARPRANNDARLHYIIITRTPAAIGYIDYCTYVCIWRNMDIRTVNLRSRLQWSGRFRERNRLSVPYRQSVLCPGIDGWPSTVIVNLSLSLSNLFYVKILSIEIIFRDQWK